LSTASMAAKATSAVESSPAAMDRAARQAHTAASWLNLQRVSNRSVAHTQKASAMCRRHFGELFEHTGLLGDACRVSTLCVGTIGPVTRWLGAKAAGGQHSCRWHVQ
jgi:hypothetical protein